MATRYIYQHIPGHSGRDHYAQEIMARARSERRTTKKGMEGALRRAVRAAGLAAASAPRIDVVAR